MTTSTTDTVHQCRDLLELLPHEALAKAQAAHPGIGGFAVFPVYAPLEIIHAAGLMPVGLFGVGNKIECTHADSRFASFICSIAKSTLELFLRGDMKPFSGAVFSSICDVARNLASVAKRNTPDLYVEYLHLPQNMASERSLPYTISEYVRFRENLSMAVGRPISDHAIRRSLHIYNHVRRLTRDLYAHRRVHPGTVSAADVFAVVQAGTRMMPEDFVVVLERFLGEVRARSVTPRDTVRVVLEGSFCEQPPLDLIDAIEAAGCQIMDDDLVVGWRLFKGDIPESGDPMESLARAYIADTMYTSVRYDRDNPRTTGLLRRVKAAGADAVIFSAAKFCEPALLDYVLFRRTLDEAGIPHLKLEFEEKMWTFDRLRTEVETFTESMLFD
jgi:benzoyl-CoA reductase subunit C